jgi:type IV pilus assembly protein PilN
VTTTASAPPQLWSTMPGWGIAADLTPPELINSRELKKLRRWLGAGLVVLLIACAGGYVAAARQHSSASTALDDMNAQTSQLQAGVRKYAGLTQMQGSVTQIQAQIATLMGGDVDLVTLMGRLRSVLPKPMTISSETVTLTAAVAGATPAGTGTAVATIGAVTLSGTGRALGNLATYVDKLSAIPGVVDVNPTTNTLAGKVSHYTLSLNLTTVALSHRFDVTKTGTK